MADYVKHTEGKHTLFLIPIKEDSGKTIYLDFSRVASPAINQDRKGEHGDETGPEFGYEVYRAGEYAEYLRECKLTVHNFQRFGTNKGYALFVEHV